METNKPFYIKKKVMLETIPIKNCHPIFIKLKQNHKLQAKLCNTQNFIHNKVNLSKSFLDLVKFNIIKIWVYWIREIKNSRVLHILDNRVYSKNKLLQVIHQDLIWYYVMGSKNKRNKKNLITVWTKVVITLAWHQWE